MFIRMMNMFSSWIILQKLFTSELPSKDVVEYQVNTSMPEDNLLHESERGDGRKASF